MNNTPNYPENFYDYGNGVNLKDDEVQRLLNVLYESDCEHEAVRTGNSIVIRLEDEIIVAQDYKSYKEE
jgi:hypothetical protein